jgi:tRNA threonylcarbamoyladenosine biosynthesis protein TsaE
MMPAANFEATLSDVSATSALGVALAQALRMEEAAIHRAGFAIGLAGDLGSGKTTLVRALLRELGVTGAVKSPSFSLLEPYVVSRLNFYHFDFYRFKSPTEFPDGGFGEYFGPGAVCLVEWPERAGEFLPPIDLHMRLVVEGKGRRASAHANTEIGQRCLDLLTNGPAT